MSTELQRFLWKTMEGEVLTLDQMSTRHMFNCMKMCFNHLAVAYGGEPVWFNHEYEDYVEAAQEYPIEMARLVAIFVVEIERRKDLPEKYREPYAKIISQIRGPLFLSSPQLWGVTELRKITEAA